MINQDIEADNIKRQWVDFFDRYDYNDQINKLRSDYPEVKSLYISYSDLSGYSSEFIEGLMKDPYYYLTIGEFYIKETLGITYSKVRRINIRLENIPEVSGIKYEIRNVRSSKYTSRRNESHVPQKLGFCSSRIPYHEYVYISPNMSSVLHYLSNTTKKLEYKRFFDYFKAIN